jgi:hypothetical protein
MRSRAWSRALLVVLALGLPVRARAQTSDIVFGGWSWRARDPGSRPAGLGGAYVAVADSIRTAAINPAGIALVPKAELSVGTSALWAGIGISLRHTAPATPTGPAGPAPVTTRPTQPGRPVPCAPPRQTRPLALALFVEQSVNQDNQIDVVRGPSLSESGTLSSTTETAGLTLARGLTPWLDLGATVTWRHVQMDGQSTLVDLAGDELSQITIGGDANKARAIAGALATFGPLTDPTAFRLGVAYQRDIVGWSVERTAIDRVRGVVSGPTPIDLEEPPVLTAGAAWRVSDTWLVSGEVDYIWYDRIGRALARNTDLATASGFRLGNGVEPRLGLEMTTSSPLGGDFKLRAGIRRETSGRLAYAGSNIALQQAFAAAPSAFRAGGGASLLGEFYENAFRLDVDVSQVVVQRLTSVRGAGRRRLSLALTVRL